MYNLTPTAQTGAIHPGLENIVHIVGNVFEAHTAVLFLRQGFAQEDADGQTYKMASVFSLSDDVDKESCLAPGEGLVGWLIRNKRPLLITNFDKKRGHLGYYRGGVRSGGEQAVRAFMGCPLAGGMGALCLDSKRTYSFSEKDQKILAQFAQLAHTLNAEASSRQREAGLLRYYQCLCALSALRERFTRWEVFLENYLTLLAQATGFEHCSLAVRGKDGASYHLEGASGGPLPAGGNFTMGSGLVGWVFKHNATVVHVPGEAGARSLYGAEAGPVASAVCLPLLVHKKVRGVLCLASSQAKPVEEDLKDFATLAASNLALFLENLYLKNRLTP